MSHQNGWDILYLKPGISEKEYCRVCNQEMDVVRNHTGSTSWVESKAGVKRESDLFTCPNVSEKWHKQVLFLRQEIEETHSRKLRDLLWDEIQEILKTKIPTIDF